MFGSIQFLRQLLLFSFVESTSAWRMRFELPLHPRKSNMAQMQKGSNLQKPKQTQVMNNDGDEDYQTLSKWKTLSIFCPSLSGRDVFSRYSFWRKRSLSSIMVFPAEGTLAAKREEVLWWQFYVKGSGKVHIKCHWRDVVSIAIYMGINVSYIEYALYLVLL